LHHARHRVQPPTPPKRQLSGTERIAWLGGYITLPLLVMLAVLIDLHMAGSSAPHRVLEYVAITGMRAGALTLLVLSTLLRARLVLFGYSPTI